MATEAHAHGDHSHHVTPLKTYYMVFGSLVGLTILTVAVSEVGVNFGIAPGSALSVIVAMAVALTKATLVCTWFMHLIHDTKFNIFIFSSALWFAMIFWFFTMADIGSRGRINEVVDNFELRKDLQALNVAAPAAGGDAPAAEAKDADHAEGGDHH